MARGGANKFKAKDGLWYETYRDMANANRKVLDKRIEVLGIAEAKASLVKKKKRSSPSQVRRAAPSPELEIRRSKRIRKKKNNNNNSNIIPKENLDEKEMEEMSSAPEIKILRRVPKRRKTALSEEELQSISRLSFSEDWIGDIYHFLREVPHGAQGRTVSGDNARSVVRQIEVLASGDGVTYHHWPKHVVFKKGIKIHMSMDFVSLYNEAVEFEAKYGRDRGNGWLLRHPIRKLELYQTYMLTKNNDSK